MLPSIHDCNLQVLDAVRQASREVLNEDLLSETGHYAPLAAYMARYEVRFQ